MPICRNAEGVHGKRNVGNLFARGSGGVSGRTLWQHGWETLSTRIPFKNRSEKRRAARIHLHSLHRHSHDNGQMLTLSNLDVAHSVIATHTNRFQRKRAYTEIKFSGLQTQIQTANAINIFSKVTGIV